MKKFLLANMGMLLATVLGPPAAYGAIALWRLLLEH